MFYIHVGLYRESIEKLCLKPLGIDIMYVASFSDLFQMFVQIMPMGAKSCPTLEVVCFTTHIKKI